MTVQTVARSHYLAQRALKARTIAAARKIWAELDPADLTGSYKAARASERLFVAVSAAQLAAAASADRYTTSVLAEQDVDVEPEGRVNPPAFAGVASDGRSLDSLLVEPVIQAKASWASGSTLERGSAAGEAALVRIVGTQIADAGRTAVGTAITARPRVGWVRQLVGPSCSRCAVLAGKWFRYNQGFQRHPLCDCTHIPAQESVAGDLTTDPKAYFNSLSAEDQDRYFTKAGAQAIRDGADIGQVVNARRGMSTTVIGGRKVKITNEGITSRGSAGKRLAERFGTERVSAGTALRHTSTGLQERAVTRTQARGVRVMPETIYEVAKDRADAIRLLKANGFLT